MTINYPAPSGSYNQVDITTPTGVANPTCAPDGSSAGLLFLSATNDIEICTNNGGAQTVPYPEICYNRFCSTGSALCTSTANLTNAANSCPAGYILATAAKTGGSFAPDSTHPALIVHYAVCCSGNNSNAVYPS